MSDKTTASVQEFEASLNSLEAAGYPQVAGSLRKIAEVALKHIPGENAEEQDEVYQILTKAFPPKEEEEGGEEQAAAAEEEGVKCPECGEMNEPGSTECASCGAALGGAEEEGASEPGANPEEQGIQEENPAAAAADEEQAVQKVQMIVIDLLEQLGLVEESGGGVVKAVDFGGSLDMLRKSNHAVKRMLSSDIAQIAAMVETLSAELNKKVGAGPVLRDLGPMIPGLMEKQTELEDLRKSVEAEPDPLRRQQKSMKMAQLEIAITQAKQLNSGI